MMGVSRMSGSRIWVLDSHRDRDGRRMNLQSNLAFMYQGAGGIFS